MNNRIDITPDTRVGKFLDDYPELEDFLVGLVPEFSKLKNPILRRTIARVTSLRQAAAVGKISVNELVGKLRKEAGLSENLVTDDAADAENMVPVWLFTRQADRTLDARPMLEEGKHPLEIVLSEVHHMKPGEVFELITSFVPAPLLDRVKSMGHRAFTVQKEDAVYSRIVVKG